MKKTAIGDFYHCTEIDRSNPEKISEKEPIYKYIIYYTLFIIIIYYIIFFGKLGRGGKPKLSLRSRKGVKKWVSIFSRFSKEILEVERQKKGGIQAPPPQRQRTALSFHGSHYMIIKTIGFYFR
jgi:hypothetical protein